MVRPGRKGERWEQGTGNLEEQLPVSPSSHAIDTMTVSARTMPSAAHTAMSVRFVAPMGIPRSTAQKRTSDGLDNVSEDHTRVLRPRYMCGFLWGRHDLLHVLSASYRTTLDAKPFLRPPPPEVFHLHTLRTVRDYPELFKIIMPIKVDALMAALSDHPNRPLVESLGVVLTEGFWPWARLDPQRYPHMHDTSGLMPVNNKFLVFMRKQRDAEISVG